MSMCRVVSCVVGRGCLLWPVHFLSKTLISLCPASFHILRPNLPVTPGVSWLPTFAFLSPIMKRTSFLVVSSKRSCRSRSFRYDLNQIPYDYTVEVRNRFKGLDLIECLMNYGLRFVTLCRRQVSRPCHEKEMQKSKMAVWGGLTNSCEKKRSEKQRRKGKI